MFNKLIKNLKSVGNSAPLDGQLDTVSQTKRWLFKGVATAGVAVAAVGGLVGLRSEKSRDIDSQAAYDRDVLPGDKILQENGFEEISREETEAMVQMFIDDYEHKRQA